MNPVFLIMSAISVGFVIFSPVWQLNIIAAYCAYKYFVMAGE